MGNCWFGKSEHVVEGEDGEHRVKVFSYNELRKATHDFSGANKIGEGGFGSVFRGVLKDGTTVAVKVLSATSRQGIREFLTELTAISDIKHENLVTLIGCCAEGSHRILIYNYLENNSLSQTLLGSRYSNIRFNWRSRVKIAFLFRGYLAPEYAIRGQVTKKSDIYSFGVLLLEIVSGRCNTNTRLPSGDQFLLERTWVLYEEGRLDEIIDIDVGDDLDIEEACRFLKIGLLCTQDAMARRPNMTNVARMLTGERRVSIAKITRPAMIADFTELKVNNREQRSNGTRSPTKSFSTTEPFSSSETPTQSSM
ncbi:hypothetical protein PR202_ga19022 [Eleusine coracana subsp. coracana]|uniref:Protein kinase domain-containing protein n=1 Tax=Eleusine coracana subsp. coracana TaxID=191504 RepID=A0AAV5CVB0_ELECO|nr:hypothetical protein PR202_ga19022 [Eleusine coracana subsp. coracana]